MTKAARSSVSATPRKVIFRTRGRKHGPITRLVSPSDVGELIKPFVFLDAFEAEPANTPGFGWHPHSGIATLTVILEGQSRYEETTGKTGVLSPGGVEWMQAGGGVWHTGGPVGTAKIKGFQLWVALPEAHENEPAKSHYLSAAEVPVVGQVRVVLGDYNGTRSPIAAPASMNYLVVDLEAGERFHYQPPQDHHVAWLVVYEGELSVPEEVSEGELIVFEENGAPLEITAESRAGLILGSAQKHPHDLVMGYYSVHTSADALQKGEAAIERIGKAEQARGTFQKKFVAPG